MEPKDCIRVLQLLRCFVTWSDGANKTGVAVGAVKFRSPWRARKAGCATFHLVPF